MAPLLFTAQPAAVQAHAGDTVTFTVGAESLAPLSYQWRFDGTNLPGATASTLTLPGVGGAQEGPYSVAVIDFYGVVASTSASLSVNFLVEWGGLEGNIEVPPHSGA